MAGKEGIQSGKDYILPSEDSNLVCLVMTRVLSGEDERSAW